MLFPTRHLGELLLPPGELPPPLTLAGFITLFPNINLFPSGGKARSELPRSLA